MIFKIENNTHIKAPIQRCFDLARSIDFHKISLQKAKEEAIGGITTGLIGENQHVLFQTHVANFRYSSEMRVIKYNPPFYLSYEIVNSLFKSVIHDYYFYDIGKETVMVDHLYFETRYGFIGDVSCEIFLKNFIKNLIKQRNAQLQDYAETAKWQSILPIEKPQITIVC